MGMERFKHSFKDTLKENLALAVYNTGHQKCEGQYAWGPALRDHYLIHFVSAGKGTFRCGRREFSLQAGELFLIYPDEVVAYIADQRDPWEYAWVGFNGTEAQRLLNMTAFTREQPVCRPADPEKVRRLLLGIYRASGNTPAADAEMAGRLYLLMGELIRQNGGRPRDKGPREYLAQALRFIQYNYAGDIGVEDIARYTGISRSQLYRAFREAFGISPQEFLLKYRINEACSLLGSRDVTVAEAAGSVGFCDPLYFSRVFKKVKGMPPTDYQRSKREDGGK